MQFLPLLLSALIPISAHAEMPTSAFDKAIQIDGEPLTLYSSKSALTAKVICLRSNLSARLYNGNSGKKWLQRWVNFDSTAECTDFVTKAAQHPENVQVSAKPEEKLMQMATSEEGSVRRPTVNPDTVATVIFNYAIHIENESVVTLYSNAGVAGKITCANAGLWNYLSVRFYDSNSGNKITHRWMSQPSHNDCQTLAAKVIANPGEYLFDISSRDKSMNVSAAQVADASN